MNNGISRDVLFRFLGFGNGRANVVFIGMEEGLSVPPPLEEQLAERSRFPQLIDLAESASVHASRFFESDRPPIQSTWNIMIRVLLAIDGNVAPTLDDLRFYQRRRLGRSDGDSALLELLPLPSSSTGEWPYAGIFPEYPSRETYLRDQLPKRKALLQAHLRYSPRLIVAYGSSYWIHYRGLYADVDAWETSGPFSVGKSIGTTIILTPHFTARQMNGQRDALIGLCLEAMA